MQTLNTYLTYSFNHKIYLCYKINLMVHKNIKKYSPSFFVEKLNESKHKNE